MNKKITKKIIAVLCATFVIFSSLGCLCAFAEQDDLTITVSARPSVKVGNTLTVSIDLELSDDLIEKGGVFTLNTSIKYDKNIFTPVNPETLEEVTTDGDGVGAFVTFGNAMRDESLQATLLTEGKINLDYGDRNSENIITSGTMATMMFKINPDLTINNSLATKIEAVESNAHSAEPILDDSGALINYDVQRLAVSNTNWNGSVIPPFSIIRIGSAVQDETKTINGVANLDDGTVLNVYLKNSSGNVVDETTATVANKSYTTNIVLDKENHPKGTYTLSVVCGDMSVSETFNINAAAGSDDEPSTPSTPSEPDDDEPSTPSTPSNPSTPDTPSEPDAPSEPSAPSTPANPDVEGGNTDITYPSDIAGHWAEDNIKYVYNYKIMNGYPDGTFGTNIAISRAEFATVMAKLLGIEPNNDGLKFSDVSNHWAKGYVAALSNLGVINGVSDDSFAPDAKITREQIAVIISRAMNLAEAGSVEKYLDDADISSWAAPHIYAVKAAKIMEGADGKFAPKTNATRAEVAKVVSLIHIGL